MIPFSDRLSVLAESDRSALPAPGMLGPKQADWCREKIPFFADMESANKASKEPVKPK